MNTAARPPAINRAAHITLLAVGAVALVLFVFLGMMLWQNPMTTTLRCVRATDTCRLVQTRRDGTYSWPLSLDSLTTAHVVYPKHDVGPRGVPAGYEAYLRETHRDSYFAVYNTLSGTTSLASYINVFLADSTQPELVIVHDESNMNTVAWALMIIVPLLVIGMLVFAWRKIKS